MRCVLLLTCLFACLPCLAKPSVSLARLDAPAVKQAVREAAAESARPRPHPAADFAGGEQARRLDRLQGGRSTGLPAFRRPKAPAPGHPLHPRQRRTCPALRRHRQTAGQVQISKKCPPGVRNEVDIYFPELRNVQLVPDPGWTEISNKQMPNLYRWRGAVAGGKCSFAV